MKPSRRGALYMAAERGAFKSPPRLGLRPVRPLALLPPVRRQTITWTLQDLMASDEAWQAFVRRLNGRQSETG